MILGMILVVFRVGFVSFEVSPPSASEIKKELKGVYKKLIHTRGNIFKEEIVIKL